MSKSIFIPRGVSTESLSRTKEWHFKPTGFAVGDSVTGGDIIGEVFENTLIIHKIMVPPKEMGSLTFVAPEGQYTLLVRTSISVSSPSGRPRH